MFVKTVGQEVTKYFLASFFLCYNFNFQSAWSPSKSFYLFENTDINWDWATTKQDHSVTDYQTAEHHKNMQDKHSLSSKICWLQIWGSIFTPEHNAYLLFFVNSVVVIIWRLEGALFLHLNDSSSRRHESCGIFDDLKQGREVKRDQHRTYTKRDQKTGDSHHHWKTLSIKTLTCCGLTAGSFSPFHSSLKQDRL